MCNKHKHLDFLQATISRMAANGFLLKGWAVTLIAALFALAAKEADQRFVFYCYFPLLVFWVLDGYFLAQERRFRALYDHVRKLDESSIDFSMDTGPYASQFPWLNSIVSRTLISYYMMLAIVILLLTRFRVPVQ